MGVRGMSDIPECYFLDLFNECNYYGDKCDNHPTCNQIWDWKGIIQERIGDNALALGKRIEKIEKDNKRLEEHRVLGNKTMTKYLNKKAIELSELKEQVEHNQKWICGHGCTKPAINPSEQTGSARQTEFACLVCGKEIEGYSIVKTTCMDCYAKLEEGNVLVEKKELELGYRIFELLDEHKVKIPYNIIIQIAPFVEKLKKYLEEE